MLYEKGAEPFTLVHGVINSGLDGKRIKHAWIELPDGNIYEPVLNEYMSKAEFEGRAMPSDCRRYTRMQAVRLIAKTRNWGSWTDDELASVSE